jgi:hypothetical protein
MKCVGISVVKNESDIIEIFIRHNLKYLDHLYIVDHRSQDNTLEIISNLKNEGYNLEISRNSSPRHVQAEVFNKLIREIDADFITFIDADEFLVSKDFQGVLSSLPDEKVSFINWHNYLPHKSDNKNENNVLKRIKYKLSPPDTNQHKALIPNKIYSNPNSFVLLGGHEIYYKIDKELKVASYQTISSIHLAHFPGRSLDQMKKKVFGNWLSKLADPLHASGKLQDNEIPTDHHWKFLFDLFRDDSVTEEQAIGALREVYTRYSSNKNELKIVYDPVLNNDVLKYDIKNSEPFAILVAEAEQQAAALQRVNKIILNLTREIKELGDI